jgi:hypothetical protein
MAASVAHDEMAAKTLSDRGSHEASSELVEDRVSGFGDQPNRKFREGLRESRGVRPNTGFPRIRVLEASGWVNIAASCILAASNVSIGYAAGSAYGVAAGLECAGDACVNRCIDWHDVGGEAAGPKSPVRIWPNRGVGAT